MGHRKKHPYSKRLSKLDPTKQIHKLNQQADCELRMRELVYIIKGLSKKQYLELEATFIKLKEDSDAAIHTIPIPSN